MKKFNSESSLKLKNKSFNTSLNTNQLDPKDYLNLDKKLIWIQWGNSQMHFQDIERNQFKTLDTRETCN